ncbi:nuclear transport factor 2 family protein [Cupriavidus pauculus]|jgi:hypothetical protein|uniref:nuclear transport factor 2 family protein n=1 Tax=Cupriavidus pauculus TaxID=82633 RepID=UPI0030F8F3F7
MNPATDLPPPTDPSHRDSLCALLAWYETLTPASLEMLGQFYAPDARFRDPFNDVRGTAAIHAIFVHMFNTVESARFTMATPMASGADAYVPWTFTGKVRGRAFDVPGCSRLHFNAHGRVSDHQDFWDAATLWRQLPMIGAPVRWLAKRFATQG